jgi:hypothetical protein
MLCQAPINLILSINEEIDIKFDLNNDKQGETVRC